jgi:co-chaperonin GroES (HSP10)
VKNESGITPCGPRILVLPEDVETKTASGIVLQTASTEKMEALAQTFGIVVAMGPLCYLDQPNQEPWCKVGDRVSFAKYSGLLNTGKDKKKYRVISDLDIVSVIDKDVK